MYENKYQSFISWADREIIEMSGFIYLHIEFALITLVLAFGLDLDIWVDFVNIATWSQGLTVILAVISLIVGSYLAALRICARLRLSHVRRKPDQAKVKKIQCLIRKMNEKTWSLLPVQDHLSLTSIILLDLTIIVSRLTSHT